MKCRKWLWTLLLLTVAATVFQTPAQQTVADRKLFEEILTQAEKGDAKSQSDLGSAFFFGQLGVAKDEVRGLKWFRKAAAQNHALAQFNLGCFYYNGEGVAKDEVEAMGPRKNFSVIWPGIKLRLGWGLGR